MNTTDNADQFIGNIQQGRWDQVLRTVAQMNLPAEKLIDLYEQIIIELIELGEMIAARQLLRETSIMQQVRDHQTDRYLHLEHSLSLTAHFDPVEAYGVEGKRRRRLRLAESLAVEMTRVQPGRLLALLGQALRWQQTQGLLPQPSATTASIATTTTAATITADSIAAQRMDLFRGIFQPVRADSATLAATESTLTDGRDSVVPTEGIRCYATIKVLFHAACRRLITCLLCILHAVWSQTSGRSSSVQSRRENVGHWNRRWIYRSLESVDGETLQRSRLSGRGKFTFSHILYIYIYILPCTIIIIIIIIIKRKDICAWKLRC